MTTTTVLAAPQLEEDKVVAEVDAEPDGAEEAEEDCPPLRRRNDVGEGLAFTATRPRK